MNCELILTYDTPALWQTGSRNLTDPKTLPTIWGTYMKLVTKYQISAINSCWEKCDEKCAYTCTCMFNVYKDQLIRQTGSRNLTDPKTLLTIWYTYIMLVTKYQISAINSYWEKCDEKYLGRMEGWKDGRTDGQTDRGKTVYSPPPSGSGGIKTIKLQDNFLWGALFPGPALRQLDQLLPTGSLTSVIYSRFIKYTQQHTTGATKRN
jgi:hypothetical protein